MAKSRGLEKIQRRSGRQAISSKGSNATVATTAIKRPQARPRAMGGRALSCSHRFFTHAIWNAFGCLSGRVGVWRRVGHGSAVRSCVWAWRRGVARRETRMPRTCRCGRGSRLAASVGPPTVCVCVTQPGTGCGVCVCAARGAGKGRARRATLHRQAVDHRMRSTAWVSVCVRWPMLVVVRAPWSQKRCASWRKFVGGGGRVLPCGRDTPRAWQGVVWAVFFWGGHRARWGG